jgi:hypothetical protein
MGNVISFDAFNGRRNVRRTLSVQLELQHDKGNRARYASNGWSRRAIVRQFQLGKSIRTLGRLHAHGEAGAEADIRAALIGDPAVALKAAA